MRTAVLAAFVALACAGDAMAQRSTQMTSPNQNNAQDNANQERQPLNAQQAPASGSAEAMPTPTLSQPMSKSTQSPLTPNAPHR